MRAVDAGVDDGDSDAQASDTELRRNPIRADERDALVEEVDQSAVVLDRPEARQTEETRNLCRCAPHAHHWESAELHNLNPGRCHRRQIEHARIPIEGDDGFDRLIAGDGREHLQEKRVDFDVGVDSRESHSR